MTAMRALPLLLLSGCFWRGGEASRVEEVGDELRRSAPVLSSAPDRHPYADPFSSPLGSWARYREGARELTIAVTGEEDGARRVEVVEEGEPRLVSVRLVGRDGVVRRAWSGTPGGPAVEQPLQQSSPGAAPPPTGVLERGPQRLGDRMLPCTIQRMRTEDLEGRVHEETWVWSAEAPPLYAAGPYGGLVRRRGRGADVDLLRFGDGATPSIPPPR
jgi:hypothetical protein